jgi:hypothetical protein
MSHPDPLFDPDNSYEDDDMVVEHDPSDILFVEYLYDGHEDVYEDDMNYDDHNDFWGLPENELDEIRDQMDDDEGYDDDYDDSMDGDHDSAMSSCGWGTDEDYGYYGDDDREDFHSDDGYGSYDD